MKISHNDTQILKGIALLLLLIHHCLYTGEGFDDYYIHNRPVFMSIGIFSKVCVAIFVFLSGYGLTMQSIKQGGIPSLLQFYRRRYLKLMMNFWLIWLLFVPPGVFLFHRTFPIVYGDQYIFRTLQDLVGLCTSSSYNATWWFYGCIIVLYLLFPFLYLFRNLWFLLIPFSIVLGRILVHLPFFGTSGCDQLLLTFVCGMSLAYLRPNIVGGIITKIILTIIFLCVCMYRFYSNNPIFWDSAITLNLVALYIMIGFPRYMRMALSFLGHHSWNIFLFHTFIYYYYFHDVIYWSRNPVLIVTTLLVICTLVSLAIEWLKSILGINKLQDKLTTCK